MKKMQCLRCGAGMSFSGIEKLQMGQAGLVSGMWSNIFSGAMKVGIYICPECRKIEFYAVDDDADMDINYLPKKTCPGCGKHYDFDYPKCPFCKDKY